MSNIFFISDTHFGHEKLVGKGAAGFSKPMHGESCGDGESARPFATIEEHDEALLKNWNSVVGVNDTVYHLGDFAVGGDISDRVRDIISQLNGRMNLTPGNHCTWKKIQEIMKTVKNFNKLQGSFEFRGDFILQHIPVHPREVSKRFKACVHGHLHKEVVVFDGPFCGEAPVDPRYVNVSCEQINYTPISWDDIKQRLRNDGVI